MIKLAKFIIQSLNRLIDKVQELGFLNGASGTIYGIWMTELLDMDQNIYYIKPLISKLEENRTDGGTSAIFSKDFPAPQSGLVHGYSGISLAYSATYLATQDAEYLAVIDELILLEDGILTNNKWPDLRPSDNIIKNKLNAWCTGSIGDYCVVDYIEKVLGDKLLLNTDYEIMNNKISNYN